MKQVQSKMITVDSRGFVMTSRGRVMTPIRTPYRESVDRIWSMITQDRADVIEHIGGRKIALNALNFDTDNSVEGQKEAAQVAHEVKQDGGAKVVSDIKTQNDGVHMRTGDVFSIDPSKNQDHHNPGLEHMEPAVDEQKPEENPIVDEGQKEAAQVAPEVKQDGGAGDKDGQKGGNSSNQNNNQQNPKNKNNQNNGKNGKNKHDKNKGNGGQNQNSQKTEEKKDGASETPVDGEQKPEEKPAEPTTGSDLAVVPEDV